MNLHQAYLWIGPDEVLCHKVQAFVQKWLCKKDGCGTCIECILINERRHYSLTWLVPENYYTIKQLDELFQRVSFALDPHEHYFIVIERADLLNSTSANSLLKSLEEPPAGYHYILLAPRKEGILPTIVSRCIIDESAIDGTEMHRLLSYFTTSDFSHAPALMKDVEQVRVPEKEVGQLLDACMQYWCDQYKKALAKGDDTKREQAQDVLTLIEEARKKPPMPGSSKLFLKNLFLKLTLAI